MPQFQIENDTVKFWLKVKPRSSRERLALDASEELRLELHAPPAEGEANEACIQYFARGLRLPQACVVILSGHKSRRKLIRVTGHSAAETVAKIEGLIERPGGRRAS
jgi:uncharacterized protein